MKKLTEQTKPVKEKDIKRDWHLIDVSGKTLGRIVPKIAQILQGKNKVNYVSYLDMGDYVVVINAKKIVVTGKKYQSKVYTRYSGYPGGLKVEKFSDLIDKKPEYIIKHAVSGMLPKNKYRDQRLKRLYIFSDENHPFKDKFVK
ncbi:MAG: 50S ribosomal protein L13 [Patescibacteria group bacterium]|nr:MAG: 50S ribosomal protein L13 [Patescibacteria group bacterium]